MLAYAPFEPIEEPGPPAPIQEKVVTRPHRQGVNPRHRGFMAMKGQTECNYLIIFFIFGMAVLTMTKG